MFVYNKLQIGTKIKLDHDVSALLGTILAGSIVTICGQGDRGYNIRDDDSGEVLYECGWDFKEIIEEKK